METNTKRLLAKEYLYFLKFAAGVIILSIIFNIVAWKIFQEVAYEKIIFPPYNTILKIINPPFPLALLYVFIVTYFIRFLRQSIKWSLGIIKDEKQEKQEKSPDQKGTGL